MNNFVEIIDLIRGDSSNGYCEWKNKIITVETANYMVVTFIKGLNEKIFEIEENHEIMIEIYKSNEKTLEEENLLRWWDETMDFPIYSENTKFSQKDIFNLHTKTVLTQTILLTIALGRRRIKIAEK